MEAMLFAAGMGTRLKPLTDVMPKALVKVGGQPLLKLVIDRLCEFGVDKVVVNVHHFSSQIVEYLSLHDFKCQVEVSDETSKLLDTGGGLRKAACRFSTQSPILIHNVDILSNADLKDFYRRNLNNDVTLLVSNRQSNRYLLFDDNMTMVGWTNEATGEVKSPYLNLDPLKYKKYAFSGIHLFSPSIFSLLDIFPDVFSITDFYIASCDKIKIKADLQTNLKILDVGKQDTLTLAERFMSEL